MTPDERTVLALLKQQVENHDLQIRRCVSDYESENRNRGILSHITQKNDEAIIKHDKQLFENGKGLVGRVAKLETINDQSKHNVTTWIAVGSLLVSAVMLIMTLLK